MNNKWPCSCSILHLEISVKCCVLNNRKGLDCLYLDALQEHTKGELDTWKIVRVSEDFRVIALGLPVPKYKGNPLDPPLRSRFQARDIYYLPFKVSPGINRLAIIKNFPSSDCLKKGRKLLGKNGDHHTCLTNLFLLALKTQHTVS